MEDAMSEHEASERREACLEHLITVSDIIEVAWLDEVDSTNNHAKELLLSDPNALLPRLWVADRQTSGRGRGSNSWYSPTGCLMFSLAWEPPNDEQLRERMPQLALVVGLSLASALDRYSSVKATVKWPNDIYLLDKKVAGILVESPVPDRWIIGVGINVQVALGEQVSEELRDRATSLHYWSNQSIDRESVLMECIDSFQRESQHWIDDPHYLETHWFDRCYLKERLIEVVQGSQALVGRCQGIDAFGRLLLWDHRGQKHTILAGSVRVIDEEARY